MQRIEDVKRTERPERPAQVTAKKETALSPESVPKHEDHRQIISRKSRKRKRKTRKRIREIYIKRGVAVLLLIVLMTAIFIVSCSSGKKTDAEPTESSEPAPTQPTQEETLTAGYFCFLTYDGEPQLIDMETLTNAWASEAGFEKRYTLTDAERYEVAQIVTAEAVGEPLAGKIAICQCILQACEDDGIRPAEAAARYSYSSRRPEPTDEALLAVSYVFDFGIVATTEPIKYFYNPDRTESPFHESQRYILTINNHRFYAEIKK